MSNHEKVINFIKKAGGGFPAVRGYVGKEMDMNRFTITISTIILSFLYVFCGAVSALTLDANSIADITTDVNSQVAGWEQTFAVSGDVSVWVDNRDPTWMPRIYGVNLSDVNHIEFLIDSNAIGFNQLAMSGNLITYAVQNFPSPQYIRVADITNQNNPSIFDFLPLTPYVNTVDISGSMIAYLGSDPCTYRDTVYAADVTDPCNILQYVIYVVPENYYIMDITIDAGYVSWSSENYDGEDYVQVADISDPNNPDIVTAQLPDGIIFENLDAAGRWLVSRGQQDRQVRIFAVHDYPDVNNWDIQTLWREGENSEYIVSGPRIGGPVTVWVTSDWAPALAQGPAPLAESEPGYMLKASYLMANGGVSPSSTLLKDANEMPAADVSNLQVVWSRYDMEMNLFKGLIELECGDWGYKRGDLNFDCKVDFIDFAIFAEDWLKCTRPDDEECEFGL